MCLTYAYNAMSIAKASNVRKVARPETRDDMSVTVTWLENESNRAMKVTPVAILLGNEYHIIDSQGNGRD